MNYSFVFCAALQVMLGIVLPFQNSYGFEKASKVLEEKLNFPVVKEIPAHKGYTPLLVLTDEKRKELANILDWDASNQKDEDKMDSKERRLFKAFREERALATVGKPADTSKLVGPLLEVVDDEFVRDKLFLTLFCCENIVDKFAAEIRSVFQNLEGGKLHLKTIDDSYKDLERKCKDF